jgi:Flp pilus assembly pilin Flp
MKRFKNPRGASIIEYAIILGLLAMAVASFVKMPICSIYSKVADAFLGETSGNPSEEPNGIDASYVYDSHIDTAVNVAFNYLKVGGMDVNGGSRTYNVGSIYDVYDVAKGTQSVLDIYGIFEFLVAQLTDISGVDNAISALTDPETKNSAITSATEIINMIIELRLMVKNELPKDVSNYDSDEQPQIIANLLKIAPNYLDKIIIIKESLLKLRENNGMEDNKDWSYWKEAVEEATATLSPSTTA